MTAFDAPHSWESHHSDGSPTGAEYDFSTWMKVTRTLQANADAVDRADIDGILALFDDDAKWNYSPSLSVQGHVAIREFFDERFSKFAKTSHNVGPAILSAGSEPGCVGSTAYFQSEHLLKDGSSYSVWGRYVDQLALTDERAIFLERTVVVHVQEGTDSVYHQLKRQASA